MKPILEKKLLIATQGSDFKDKVTSAIVKHFKLDSIYIQVFDIAELQGVDPNDFDALVIIHTWENWKPPVAVKAFIDRTKMDKD
jgi:menaquinone-dependent protoporphyrinogen IX oxidase